MLDEAQYDYLLMLIEGHRGAQVVTGEEKCPVPVSASVLGSGISGSDSSSGPSVSCPGPSSSSGCSSEPVMASLVSEIRDMLPEYGSGFLAACLTHYNMKSDQARMDVTLSLKLSLRSLLQFTNLDNTGHPPSSGG